jgi:TolB-like protein/cytochrome c-type biogenesis protein CcmH/NrfG
VERVTLVVLPFQNMTGDPQQEYLTDGLTEEMIAQVSRMDPERLGVIARTSAMQYKGTTKNVAQIGRELGASYILESSFRREGNRVRITAQLVSVSDQTHLWSQDYERDVREILPLESEVTQAIASEIRIKLSAKETARRGSAPVDPEAYQLYLKGRYFWNKRTEAGYVKAISYFQSAIERSPRYAQANAGLADTYALLGSMPNEEISRAEAMSKAKAAAIGALQLDDSLAEAHTSLAFVKMHYDWDWNGAEQEFRRAIALNPNYPTAHHWYSYDLTAMNRMPEALNEIPRAQQVDPLSAIINTDVAELLYYAGRYDEAIQQARVALEIDPQFLLAHSLLGEIYGEQHRYSEALAESKRAIELSGGSPWMLFRLGRTYALSGDRSQAEQALRQLEELSAKRKGMSGVIAGMAAVLGKNDEAFAAVEKACEEREGGLILLNYDHNWDPLRSDPRFQQLVRRVGLPP